MSKQSDVISISLRCQQKSVVEYRVMAYYFTIIFTSFDRTIQDVLNYTSVRCLFDVIEWHNQNYVMAVISI